MTSMTISTLVTTVWVWLPHATQVLQFTTAVIGFRLATATLVRRVRRRWRRGR